MAERFNIQIWNVWPSRYLITTVYDISEEEVEAYEEAYDDEFYEIVIED